MDSALYEPRILILDNDPAFLSQCQNELPKHGMKLMTSTPEVVSIASQIAQYKPSIIIAELYIEKMDSAQFIHETRKQSCGNNPQFIILSSYNDRNLFRECCEAGAAYCMIKPIDFHVLLKRISKICEVQQNKMPHHIDVQMKASRQNSLVVQVSEVLHQFGVPAHIRGYSYLRFAIITALENAYMLELVTKILYPTVAREFQTTSSRVERAIRHAIEVAWDRGDPNMQKKFFGYTVKSNRGKPTNSEFIALIVDNLQVENKNPELES